MEITIKASLIDYLFAVYPEDSPTQYRSIISNDNTFFLCYNGKTVKDGEYLGVLKCNYYYYYYYLKKNPGEIMLF